MRRGIRFRPVALTLSLIVLAGAPSPAAAITRNLAFDDGSAYTIDREGEAHVRPGTGVLSAVSETSSRINEETNHARGGLTHPGSVTYTGRNQTVTLKIELDYHAELQADVTTCCSAEADTTIAVYLRRRSDYAVIRRVELVLDKRYLEIEGPITTVSGPTSPSRHINRSIQISSSMLKPDTKLTVAFRLYVGTLTRGWAHARADSTIENISGSLNW
jgi:hypothetical protein